MTRTSAEILLFITSSPELMLLLKTTLVLALGLSIVWIARTARASVRHLMLACTFAGLIALPIAVMLAPSFKFEIAGSGTETATPLETVGHQKSKQPGAIAVQTSNPATQSATSTLSLRTVLWLSWATIATLLLCSLGMSLFRLRRVRRSAIPSLETQAQLDSVLAASGINRRVEVLLHEQVASLLLMGSRDQ